MRFQNFTLGASLLAFALSWSAAASACVMPMPEQRSDRMLLVGNKGEDTLSFIDLNSGEELDRLTVSATAPHEVAVSPNRMGAAVVNYGAASVDLFNTVWRRKMLSIPLGENTRPHGIVWLSDNRIVVTTEGSQSIVVLTPHDSYKPGANDCMIMPFEKTAIPTGQDGTHMVAISPDETVAYTANMQSGTVSRIELATKAVTSAPAGAEVEGVAVSADGRELWASVRGENTVMIFDADTLDRQATIEVGQFPLRIAASPDGTHMVTSNLLDGSLSVIDVATREVVRTIPVGGDATSAQVTILFNKDGSLVYVAETGTDTVAEVDFETGKVLRRLNAGRQGDGLALWP